MIRLHGYWRSGASYRVRIALNLKAIPFVQVTHDLRRGEQKAPEYLAIQPQAFVPALEADGSRLIQSPAILEWLDEQYPEPPLLPEPPLERATVRAMAAIIACDIHPINNLRILGAIRDLGASEAQVSGWIARWILEDFAALECLVTEHGGAFAFGDTPTLADIFLVPQIYAAERFAVDLGDFPRLTAAAARTRGLPAFAAAHPSVQSDADPG